MTKAKVKKRRAVIPRLLGEAEEAEWWDCHHKLVENTLFEAIEKGKDTAGNRNEAGAGEAGFAPPMPPECPLTKPRARSCRRRLI